jgi:hypothetical protein
LRNQLHKEFRLRPPGVFGLYYILVPVPPSDGIHNSKGVKKYEYNNAFLYFFTHLLLHAPSCGDAGTTTMDDGLSSTDKSTFYSMLFDISMKTLKDIATLDTIGHETTNF